MNNKTNIPGIGMKFFNRALVISAAAALCLLASTTCRTAETAGLGWVDDSHYRVEGVGIAKKGFANPEQKHKSACAAALIMAQMEAGKALGSIQVKQENSNTTASIGFSPKGKVVNETYDPATESCRVILEITVRKD